MKKSLLIPFTILSVSLHAQYQQGIVNFETAPYNIRENFVKMDVVLYPGTGNIWQVGRPGKTFFDSAYSPVNAAVTDTLNPYPVNIHSYFDVVIYDMQYLWANLMSQFSFRHKYNTTKGKDGGYIMVSTDSRQTWNILTDSSGNLGDWCWGCQWRNASSVYSDADTLGNGMPAFSGTSNGWVTTSMMFGSMAVKNQPFDTLIFRFIFQSDSIADTTSNEGWMIDDIFLSENYTYGITTVSGNNNRIYPNPANSQLTISNHITEIIHVRLVNLLGTEVKSADGVYKNSVSLDVSELPPGMYITQVQTKDGLSLHRIIVSR